MRTSISASSLIVIDSMNHQLPNVVAFVPKPT